MGVSVAIPSIFQTPRQRVHQNSFGTQCSPRSPSTSSLRRRVVCQALDDLDLSPDGLVVMPVFPGSSVLLPTSRGMLRAFEPRFLDLFNRLRETSASKEGRGARFLHILSPKLAPPAMLDNSPPAIQGLPSIGCCAVIESIKTAPDGSLVVEYSGHRRMLLHLVQNRDPSSAEEGSDSNSIDSNSILYAAGEWYDDIEPENLDPSGTVSSIYAAEGDVAGIVDQIAKLSRKLDPENNARLPDALIRYAPSGQKRPTSYDALKAAKHPAAASIDMWRRSGSKSSSSPPRDAHADPYSQVGEQVGRLRRQELYSYAAAQLLQLGIPEATALLLSRDTAGRLQFVLEAARPYLAQLSAEAALKGALE